MPSLKPPDPASGGADEELDPDRIDRLLADMEEELDKMPSDILAAQELRQELDTFRAMVESLHANHGWRGEEYRVVRQAIQDIAQRLKTRFG